MDILRGNGKEKNLRASLVVLISTLLVLFSIELAPALLVIPNPDEFRYLTTSGPETVDPIRANDEASMELIWNVYQGLCDFDFVYVDRFAAEIAEWWPGYGENPGNIITPMPPHPHQFVNISNVDPYHPTGSVWSRKGLTYYMVASEDGLFEGERVAMSLYPIGPPPDPPEYNYIISDVNVKIIKNQVLLTLTPLFINQTWYFRIRTGVQWQDPLYGNVTPFDVEYSIERGMVEDPFGGPMYHFYEPLTGKYSSRDWNLSDPNEVRALGIIIDDAVESNGTHVWFNLVKPYMPFQETLCRAWASILDADWAIEDGCWNASWHVTPGDYTSWVEYNNQPPPLGLHMMGCGPYYLDFIDPLTGSWRIKKFDGYWAGWTKPHCSTIIHEVVPEWAERKARFLSDDPATQADIVTILPQDYEDPDLLAAIAAGRVRYINDLPERVIPTAVFYGYNITDPSSPYMHYLGGVPKPDLFSDKDMRLAFTYLLDIDGFCGNEYCPLHNPVIYGVLYCNATKHSLMHYHENIALATQHFQQAWGGLVWNQDFRIVIVYPSNVEYRMIAEMLEYIVENEIEWPVGLTKDIVTVELSFPVFLTALYSGQIGFFIWGSGDYGCDPHPWIFNFMHTQGDFGSVQHIQWGSLNVDGMIEEALGTMDPVLREQLYNELMDIYHYECPSVPIKQSSNRRHYERPWVQGWFYHPCLYPRLMFYGTCSNMNIWKEEPETVTRDITLRGGAIPDNPWIIHAKVTNIGETPEPYIINATYWDANGNPVYLSPIYGQYGLLFWWLKPGESYTHKFNATLAGQLGIAFKIIVGSPWHPPTFQTKILTLCISMVVGDLGSGPPPKYWKFDGKVDGYDLSLFLNAQKFYAGKPVPDPFEDC